MPSIDLFLRLTHRQRRNLAAVVAASALIGFVLANQPPGSAAHPEARPAAARPADRSAVLPLTAATPTPAPLPVLRLLHAHLAFTDDSASHSGAPNVKATAGILVDLDTGSILWQRDMHAPLPPASTTKVLSTMVALENFDPGRLVTVTPDALHQAGDETVMGLRAGDQLTVEELLDGMLTVSGNDAATALAVDTVGMDAFVAAMNRQLEALGLHDSHFVTPVGLDDPQQRASAYDLATIAALDVESFPVFRQIVSQTEIDLPATAQHGAFYLGNLNRLLRIYPGADGIKPGSTGDAGPCLIGMAERGGHRLLSVVLDAPELYTDSRDLLDWGFVQEGVPSALPTPAPAKKRP
ncbi:MAG TPA: D-alanyl-D-alanine carboxypeptidase family protein [Candidatus Dormibacteraeota bacterium]|nr:D-alanyl-D-alanine carboxypeptidase family protein [Candidatus Dormibacteraeota bacterium]